MTNRNTTKVTIREDKPVALASSAKGANLTAVGFNIEFLIRRRPSLAIEIARLFDQARQLHEDDPQAPEEDFRAANEEWSRLVEAMGQQD